MTMKRQRKPKPHRFGDFRIPRRCHLVGGVEVWKASDELGEEYKDRGRCASRISSHEPKHAH